MTSTDFLDLKLDRLDARPLYQQIKQAVAEDIESGILPPTTRLPASRRLANQLGVNRVTVVTAYAELEAEGYISSHVGRGTFVLDRATQQRQVEPVAPPTLRNPSDWNAHNFNREMMRLARQPGLLSFAPGMPATDLLPADGYRLALNTVLRREGATVLQYGPIEGYPPLHESIAQELAGFGMPVEPEQILVTSGTEQALALVLRTLLKPGDSICIEQPTYMHVLDLLAGSGIQVFPIPSDNDGLRIEVLAQVLAQRQPRLLYLTPTYQNPTGSCMALDRRINLLKLARSYNLAILEDDVYRHLWLDHPPPLPLRALDEGGLVLYTNGYSKCLLPGARIGYLVAPASYREALDATHQTLDITATELNQRALTEYLRRDQLEVHLEYLRSAYRARRSAMLRALQLHMPVGTSWTEPAGGLFFWVSLPFAGPGAASLYVHALELGVTFAPGNLFFSPGRGEIGLSAGHNLRLNFVLHPPDAIEDGIRRLARAWQMAAGAT